MNSDQALSVKDVIKKSFLDSIDNPNSINLIMTFVLSMLIALLMGLFIYAIYKKSFRGVVYSQSFAITLVGICIITCMITLAISTNVVLSLGMVGALSIVRYRTAIKEPMDLLFLFWSISSGISIGAKSYMLTAISALVIVGVLLLLNRKNSGQAVYIMIVHYVGDDISDEIKRIIHKTKYQIKSKTMRGDTSEMAIEVLVKNNNFAFAEHIRNLERVNDLTVIQYNGEFNG
jgi:hypothetical protein